MMRRLGRIMKSNITDPSAVHNKEGFANFVTDDDVRIQKELIDGLSGLFPGCGFYGEEDTEGNNRMVETGLSFYIDPIDGTTNYVFGYHHSCIYVGVSWEGKMIAGFVYNPYTDDLYSAIRGCGSCLNGRVLHMKDRSLDEGIVAFGCARYNDGDTDAIFEIAKELYLNSLSIRNGGSSTLDLCRIASGSNVAYVELK